MIFIYFVNFIYLCIYLFIIFKWLYSIYLISLISLKKKEISLISLSFFFQNKQLFIQV